MSAAAAIQQSTWSGWSRLNEEPDTSEADSGRPLLHIGPYKRSGGLDSEGLGQPGVASAAAKDEPPRAAAVVVPKASSFVHNKFVPLQKWEGVVLKTNPESFFARLVDLTSPGVGQEAEFPLEEVAPSDRELLAEGAVFYWHIGYLDQIDGQRVRASSLRFRRLPAWTGRELKEAEEKAKRLAMVFANG
jgi:hypothetical protein